LSIPAAAPWRARRARIGLETHYPLAGGTTLRFDELGEPARFSVALRVPAWAASAGGGVNGKRVQAAREAGYAIVTRRWKAGDSVAIDLPVALRVEATRDDPDTVAILRG